MKTVIFQGYLKKLYPEGIKLHADSAEQAIALLGNYPGFRVQDDVKHRVYLPKFPTVESIRQRTDSEVIEVCPLESNSVPDTLEFSGAGGGERGSWVQIVIGAVLIVASFYAGPFQQILFTAGVSLMLGGVVQLLMPQPKKGEDSNDPRSNYLAANKNTVAIGTTIPIAFGRRKIYGHLVSYNVTATNLNEKTLVVTNRTGHAAGDVNGVSYTGKWDYENP